MAGLYPLSSSGSGVVSPGPAPKQTQRRDDGNNTTLRYLLAQKKSRENEFASTITKDVVSGLREGLKTDQAKEFQAYQEKWTNIYKSKNGRLTLQDKMEQQADMTRLSNQQKTWMNSQKNYEDQVLELKLNENTDKYDMEESAKLLDQFDRNDPNKLYRVAKAKPLSDFVDAYKKEFDETETTSDSHRDKIFENGEWIDAPGRIGTVKKVTNTAFDTDEKIEAHQRELYRRGGAVQYSTVKELAKEDPETQENYLMEDGKTMNYEDYFVNKTKANFYTSKTTTSARDIAPTKEKEKIVIGATYYDTEGNVVDGSGDAPNANLTPYFEMGTDPVTVSGQFPQMYGSDGKELPKSDLISRGIITQVRPMTIIDPKTGKPGRIEWVAQVMYSADKEAKEDADGTIKVGDATKYDANQLLSEFLTSKTEKRTAYIPYDPIKSGFKNYDFGANGPNAGAPSGAKPVKGKTKEVDNLNDL